MLLQHICTKNMRRVRRIKPTEYLLPRFKVDIVHYLITTLQNGFTQFAFKKMQQFSKHTQKDLSLQEEEILSTPIKVISKITMSNIQKIDKRQIETQTQRVRIQHRSIQTEEDIQVSIKTAVTQQSIKFAFKSMHRCFTQLQMKVKMKVLNKIKCLSHSPHIPRLKISKKQSISQTLEFIHEHRQKYQQFSQIIQGLQDQLQMKTIEYQQLYKRYSNLINSPTGKQGNITKEQSKSVVSEGEKTDNASNSGLNKSMILKCTTVTYIEDQSPRNEGFIKN